MVSSWIKGLVLYLIISGLVMKLVPGKNYERYISFYMGLILVILLARPIVFLFGISEGDIDRLSKSVNEYLTFNSYEEELKEKADNISFYESGINEAIKQDLNNQGYAVDKTSVITDKNGSFISITIYLSGDFDENNLKKLINDVYKFDLESIYIVRR
ncbi:MAG: stage III sporulation protein AF [Lachnospiraceae bacterium]|nr:stage III sporulation protein AF [Lachnospiraceae bacterium]